MTNCYRVIYEWSGRNFSGYAPDVPGCMATAPSHEEVHSALQDSLEAHLQWLRNESDLVPEASPAITVDMTEDLEFPNPPGYYVVVGGLDVRVPEKASRTQELVAA